MRDRTCRSVPGGARSDTGTPPPARSTESQRPASPEHPTQRSVQIMPQRGEARLCRSGCCSDHHIRTVGTGLDPVSHQGSQLPGDAMPDHGVAYSRRDHKPHACWALGISLHPPTMHDQSGCPRASGTTASTTAKDGGELGRLTKPVTLRQHGPSLNGGTPQAVSFSRPLRRREATMLRPARVRIRRRNPCTLERRRVFG